MATPFSSLRKNDGRINVSVGARIRPDVHARIRQLATDRKQSIAATVGDILEHGVEEIDEREKVSS